LSQKFLSGTEDVAQELFLNIAKFISMSIGTRYISKESFIKAYQKPDR
jgi:hypothetical protein